MPSRFDKELKSIYWVYILELDWQGGGKYYIGQSQNAFRAITDHIHGQGPLTTLHGGVKRIVNVLACNDRKSSILTKQKLQHLISEGLEIPEPPASFMSPQSCIEVGHMLSNT